MEAVGVSMKRVDGPDKATGRAKYTADLISRDALVAKVFRSTVANGRVLSLDISEALKVPGVVRIVTCFDVPRYYFPTAGHPWSTDPAHQDVADRLLLTDRPLYYGDDVAAVIAEDEIAAKRALRLIKAEYETYPFVLDPLEAIKEGAPQLHPDYPNNILKHTSGSAGDWDKAIAEPGLLCLDKWYETPIVQHCHIENHICCAWTEGRKIAILSSTQIPHIVRRCVGQALGRPWGEIRVIKPYIGGGFGNKQDALYEPLCAYLATLTDGRPVKLDVSREETFVNNRVRHGGKFHLVTYFRRDGTFVARQMEEYSQQGAYTSHGHSTAAKATNGFVQMYPCEAYRFDAYSVYTNTPTAGAMRAYGMPQVSFAMESHVDDIAKMLGMSPIALRDKNRMPVGYRDAFTGNVNWQDSHGQCMEKAMEYIGWQEKYKAYQNQTGPVRRGVGMAIFWYNTAVWPISLEATTSRMMLNQDGSVQYMCAETEIGQGADTAYTQMVAQTVGVPVEKVHVVTCQDTDVTGYGTGAYASRQTYVEGFAIANVGRQFREKILAYASWLTKIPAEELDLRDGNIVSHGETVMTLEALATEATYSMERAAYITAEDTTQVKSNAYSFGCSFAEVEVDIPLCKVKVLNIVNVHDCGTLINPQLAQAQVHGGMSMSIGYAMGEELKFDEKTGRPLNNNLLDYKISTAMDHPDLGALFVENPEPTSPFGTKALGEPPAVSPAPAIRNAVLQATGVEIDRLPMTPHVLFERFREEGLIHV
ncbi:MAG: xanthine dehydrogenase molybdenum-binding subunit XdhA [Oscillospiraceae bacterium]|nr:xanthine dehydrogenase molybdenum-binding subunit XdhA [Oscillospiraceae bacterium]